LADRGVAIDGSPTCWAEGGSFADRITSGRGTLRCADDWGAVEM